jgi:hypothetical protein
LSGECFVCVLISMLFPILVRFWYLYIEYEIATVTCYYRNSLKTPFNSSKQIPKSVIDTAFPCGFVKVFMVNSIEMFVLVWGKALKLIRTQNIHHSKHSSNK